MNVKQLDHINLSVANFEESAAWYTRVFGFEIVERAVRDGQTWGVLRAGDAMLCIYEYPDLKFVDADAMSARGLHRVAHFGLRITDKAAWLEMLKTETPHFHWRYPHSESWYVTDPTGWEIEVALWDDDAIRFG